MDLKSYLIELGITIAPEGHRHSTRGRIQVDCPLCGLNSGSFHLGISEAKLYSNCWKCGKQNTAWMLKLLTGQPYREIQAVLGDLSYSPKYLPIKHTGKLERPDGVRELTAAHKQYLSKRGFDPDEISEIWSVKGTGQSIDVPWRLYIPIHHQGQEVSWTARAIGSNPMRYVSARPSQEAIPHKSLLYGEDYCRHAIIVHEGPTDVWRTGPGSVATFGADHTTAQVKAIKRYPLRFICFDSEPRAQARAEKLCKSLAAYKGVTMNIKLDSKDAGSAKKDETEMLQDLIR